MKKTSQHTYSVSKAVLTVLTVLLSLTLLFGIWGAIRSIREVDYSPSRYTEEYYLSCLQHGNYTELTRMANRDQKLGESRSETIRQCQAAGLYYEAAVLYEACRAAGMEDEATRQEALMDRYAEQMGDLEKYRDKIQETVQGSTDAAP